MKGESGRGKKREGKESEKGEGVKSGINRKWEMRQGNLDVTGRFLIDEQLRSLSTNCGG
jgi:hypothetical protein